jgi:uncharacterized protein YkwD
MRPFIFAVAMIAACFFFGGVVDGFAAVTSGPDFRAEVEKETFALINQYRKAHDFPALVWNEAITREARAHSKDMATGDVDFGHDGFRGRVDRLKSEMNGFRGAGENVLMTDDPDQVAQKAVTLWLHSPHHLENIRGDFNYSGLGVWQDKEGAIYFTQIFLKFEPVAQETENQPQPVLPFGLVGSPYTRSAR